MHVLIKFTNFPWRVYSVKYTAAKIPIGAANNIASNARNSVPFNSGQIPPKKCASREPSVKNRQ
jgi:hypothetical protein